MTCIGRSSANNGHTTDVPRYSKVHRLLTTWSSTCRQGRLVVKLWGPAPSIPDLRTEELERSHIRNIPSSHNGRKTFRYFRNNANELVTEILEENSEMKFCGVWRGRKTWASSISGPLLPSGS